MVINEDVQYRKLKDQECIQVGDILVLVSMVEKNLRFWPIKIGNAHIGKYAEYVVITEDGEYVLRQV